MDGIGHVHASTTGMALRASYRRLSDPPQQVAIHDTAEISDLAHWKSRLHELPAIRQELVDRVRSEIERGAYDTPNKIDALLDALIKDLQ